MYDQNVHYPLYKHTFLNIKTVLNANREKATQAVCTRGWVWFLSVCAYFPTRDSSLFGIKKKKKKRKKKKKKERKKSKDCSGFVINISLRRTLDFRINSVRYNTYKYLAKIRFFTTGVLVIVASKLFSSIS